MTFEESLEFEINTITELNAKVYPLNAPKGTKAPFFVYISSEGTYDKTLDGYLKTKWVPCELNVVHSKYNLMKALSKKVMDKVLTFQGRAIGTNGPHIQELSFGDESPDLYENEIDMYRKVINVKFYFKED